MSDSVNPLCDQLQLLKTPEAAALLAISPRKLWSLTVSGEVPHIRIGRSVRYPLDDLRSWVNQRKEGGVS